MRHRGVEDARSTLIGMTHIGAQNSNHLPALGTIFDSCRWGEGGRSKATKTYKQIIGP